MDALRLIQREKELKEFLLEAFRRHNVECEITDDLLIFPRQRMTACAKVFNRSSSSTLVLQLDVVLEVGLGKEIIESCVGLGMDEDAAIKDAWKNFLSNSFHVLLSAFFTREFDDQINRYQWLIGGQRCDVIMSQIGMRGQAPDPLPLAWLNQFEDMVKKQVLPPGIHWMRLYYAQSQREVISAEILLDNNTWQSVENTVRSFDYPKTNDFLSVRVFLVVTAGCDVSRVAAAMAWMGDKDNEEIQRELVREGMLETDVEKAIVFMPLAFGRIFLKGITTAEFPDEAIVIDDTEKETTINLSDEPIYMEAYRLAEKIATESCVNMDHFKQIFLQSAELNAFNNALNEGAKLEDLNVARFGSPIMYFSHFIPAERVEEIIPEPEVSESKKGGKPFWKFWK
ncbi:hypothetical protein M2451_000068 [Dysgonomonas sp. PFB1-18]|uniref:DUF6348 family protein n=1 Tax=unclassified Dysgonomonas TaxID=2630389 RepID=UPI002473942D|nr:MULTISPECIES: DUF6348 family protein [unclassified Dysgonomonas]MDH6307618.1 hypothetical protein [Dysgonomonas sp. PF1-14]MDH6337536.1 hypothetical protein [Dysgonomonas sp. PF1-16]MDH6378761.1 hypothetical protein [Dysgonomonas sp. PFB1-18]MDH6399179.1 hypothetical protein [Dysgonomonas sp. PF1-23]